MTTWPDALQPPDPQHVQAVLEAFWRELAALVELLPLGEVVLGEMRVASLRQLVLEMMCAANGIAFPQGTRHLNGYLGESQRQALERTLLAEGTPRARCVASASALVTIYRWYAPQMVTKFGLVYPQALEQATWASAVAALAEWPERLETD